MASCGNWILAAYTIAVMCTDIRTGRIYNWMILIAGAAGYGVLLFCSPSDIGPVFLAGIMTLVFFFPFWRMGGIGAGDLKFFFTLVPFLGVSRYFTSILFTFLIGALFALISLIKTRNFSETIHLAVPAGIGVLLCLVLEQAGIQVNLYEYICGL